MVDLPGSKRRKMEDKINPMVLVGYHNIRAYRLFDAHTNKTTIDRDVKVLENGDCNWNVKHNEATLVSVQPEDYDAEEAGIKCLEFFEDSSKEEHAPTQVRPQRSRQLSR